MRHKLRPQTVWPSSKKWPKSSFIGQAITIVFIATLDEFLLTDFYIDDVEVLSGSSIQTGLGYVSPDGQCGGNEPCYSSIQAAINGGSTGSTVKITGGTYDEAVVLNESKSITLQGGWDSTFTSRLSDTTVNSITVGNGTVAVDRLVIR